MVRTIVYVCMNTQYRESTQNTSLGSFFDTCANCGDVFLRNSTTNNGRFEFECLLTIGIHRCEDNFTVTILTTTTGLFCILAVNSNFLGECFFVSNLRSTYVSFYLEFTKQTVNNDFQVKFTHTRDDCLSCFSVGRYTESRIFFSQLNQSIAHLILTSFGLGFDSNRDNGFREFHGFQNYRTLFITDCITSCSKF